MWFHYYYQPEGKFDLIFETTGSSVVLKDFLPNALDKDTQTILLGLFTKETLFNFTDIVENGWKFIGSPPLLVLVRCYFVVNVFF